jgi:hypothetical protein
MKKWGAPGLYEEMWHEIELGTAEGWNLKSNMKWDSRMKMMSTP